MNGRQHWFEHKFWPTYPRDLCNQIGPKSRALNKSMRILEGKPELAIEIMASLREQMLYKRKAKKLGEHKSVWIMPMAITWLNQEQWTNEIPSHYKLMEKQREKKCECGKPVHIGRLCVDCYIMKRPADWRDELIDSRLHLEPPIQRKQGEHSREYIGRLLKFTVSNLK